MKKLLPLLVVLIATELNSQNLVPNPGFESVSANFYCGVCGINDFSNSVTNWDNPTGATPDIYSTVITQSCYNFVPNTTYSGPISTKGYQMPRNGNVMAGIYCFTIPGMNQREYIQTPLSSPLEVNETYAISFYANLPNNHEKYCNKLGAYLSVGAIAGAGDQPLNYVPQVAAGGFITDTTNWVLITDTILVTAAYDYICIGNFYDDANTTTVANPGGTSDPGNYGAYYFIDDVSIIKLAPKGFEENSYNSSNVKIIAGEESTVVLFTNGIGMARESELVVEVFDLAGRIIFRREYELMDGENRFELTGITEAGAYAIVLRGKERAYTLKFVRQ